MLYYQGYIDINSRSMDLHAKLPKQKKSKNKVTAKYSTKLDDRQRVLCEATTAHHVENFFNSKLGKRSGLDIKDYGVKYILGFRWKVAKNTDIDPNTGKVLKSTKVVIRGKKTDHDNALPSGKIYTAHKGVLDKFYVLTGEVDSYEVYYDFERVQAETSLNPQPLFTPSKTSYNRKLKPRAVNNAQLAYPQLKKHAKTTHKTGGKSPVIVGDVHQYYLNETDYICVEQGKVWLYRFKQPPLLVCFRNQNGVVPGKNIHIGHNMALVQYRIIEEWSKNDNIFHLLSVVCTDDQLKTERRRRNRIKRREKRRRERLEKSNRYQLIIE